VTSKHQQSNPHKNTMLYPLHSKIYSIPVCVSVSYFDHRQEASFAAIFIAVEQSHCASIVVEFLEAV